MRRPTDLRARKAWRELLDQAARRKVDLVLVLRIDRAFRSVLDAATTLERLRGWGVGLRSYSGPWLDTTSPFGVALFHITVAYAQLERGILAECVRAGMDRARRQGKRLGRPSGTQADDFADRWEELRPRVVAGETSKKQATRVLGVASPRSCACCESLLVMGRVSEYHRGRQKGMAGRFRGSKVWSSVAFGNPRKPRSLKVTLQGVQKTSFGAG